MAYVGNGLGPWQSRFVCRCLWTHSSSLCQYTGAIPIFYSSLDYLIFRSTFPQLSLHTLLSISLPISIFLYISIYLCIAANENNSKRGSAANKSLRFCLLIEKSPINFAETEIHRIKDDDKIKRQKNIDCHCLRQRPNLWYLPWPPRFTWQTTFKGTQDWEFFWLRFWNLRYFFVSYA